MEPKKPAATLSIVIEYSYIPDTKSLAADIDTLSDGEHIQRAELRIHQEQVVDLAALL